MDERGLLDEVQSHIESVDGWWYDTPVSVWAHRIDDMALLVRVESDGRVLRLRCQVIDAAEPAAKLFDREMEFE